MRKKQPIPRTLEIAAAFEGAKYGHVAGDIVTFRGNGDPLRALTVGIDPVQEGTGDPSPDNVRPISGWSEVNVWRTGKNLYDLTLYDGGSYNPTVGTTWNLTESQAQLTDNHDGTFSIELSGWGFKTFIIPVHNFPDLTLKVKISATGEAPALGRSYGYLNQQFEVLSKANSTTITQDITSTFSPTSITGSYYFYLGFTARGNNNVTITFENPQIELGSTPTAYEPYQGNTYTIQLGQTVYGGTLDVTNGVLTGTHGIYTFSENDVWTSYSTGGKVTFNSGSRFPPNIDTTKDGIMSNYPFYKASYIGGQMNKSFCFFSSPTLSVCDDAFSDATAFATSMVGQQLVYELATPIEYTLSAAQLDTLVGQNVVWADTGAVDVEYVYDSGEEGGKLALLLRNRKELLIAMRKGAPAAEMTLALGAKSEKPAKPSLDLKDDEEEKRK